MRSTYQVQRRSTRRPEWSELWSFRTVACAKALLADCEAHAAAHPRLGEQFRIVAAGA